MPSITALLHTHNDALRLGRCLETLYPCDDILIVDHGSTDATIRLAREYGARIMPATKSQTPTVLGNEPPQLSQMDPSKKPRFEAFVSGWILCLDPRESLSESLAASLFAWKTELRPDWKSESTPADHSLPTFSVCLREETTAGWVAIPKAQTRLVPPNWQRWNGNLPSHDASAVALEGELLRFIFP